MDAVRASSARSLLDLGCGAGDLLVRLAREPRLERILGLDLNAEFLEQVRQRLDAERTLDPHAAVAGFQSRAVSPDRNLERVAQQPAEPRPAADAPARSEINALAGGGSQTEFPELIATDQRGTHGHQHQGRRIELRQGSLTEPDADLVGFDCALLIETIEHLDPRDLGQVEQAVFARMRPRLVIITTPNAEYNPLLEVPPNRFRHPDHRFEWDRSRFQRWARGVAQRHGYGLRHRDIGGVHPVYGGASQMALFRHEQPPTPRTPTPWQARTHLDG